MPPETRLAADMGTERHGTDTSVHRYRHTHRPVREEETINRVSSIPSAIRSLSSVMRWTSWGCNILLRKHKGRETEAEDVGAASRFFRIVLLLLAAKANMFAELFVSCTHRTRNSFLSDSFCPLVCLPMILWVWITKVTIEFAP